MSDNYFLGSMAGSGIYDEHYSNCRTNCIYELEDNGSGEIECLDGHFDHECNCDDIANDEDEYL